MNARKAAVPSPAPPLVLFGVAVAVMMVSRPGNDDSFVDDETPKRITRGSIPPAQAPSLRGCRGAPTDFIWVFPDGAGPATAGRPVRTRFVALDAQGRQARPSACEAIRVDVGLSGRAQVSRETWPPTWRNSELRLDIENEAAEIVEAEVRIESLANPRADVLLHTSQIRFSSGPAHGFALRIDRPGSVPPSGLRRTWPTRVVLEVVVSTQDRFGNRAFLTDPIMGVSELSHQHFALRADSKSLEFTPLDGSLHLDRRGEGRATVRSSQAGAIEIWLEQLGNNVSSGGNRALRERTTVQLEFVDPRTMQKSTHSGAKTKQDEKWEPVAGEVRDAFLHAWRGYRKYAWGDDELKPLTKRGRNDFGGIGITILDSLTTLWIMGLSDEFDRAAAFVENELDFNRANAEVSVFEVIIRALGGLLGAHTLSQRDVFLRRATELAERLLPALNSSSGLPQPKWNLALGVGKPSAEPTILAEAGSLQLEFRYLTDQTGDLRFMKAADRCFQAITSTGVTGLLPVYLTPPDHAPPRTLASKFALGALADSYYEYLLKQWLMSDDVRYKNMWLQALDEIPGLLRPKPSPPSRGAGSVASPPKYKLIEVAAGGDAVWKMDHLSCFAPAMIALGLHSLPKEDLKLRDRNRTWWRVVEGLTASCVELWTHTKSGLAPEFAYVRAVAPHDLFEIPATGRHCFLRPETAETLFYLHRFTGDEKYRRLGETMFRSIVKHGKVEAGFASVKDVNQVPTEKMDDMQSFVMAEMFKYLYLLFSPADRLDLYQYVLNTEGHPLGKTLT